MAMRKILVDETNRELCEHWDCRFSHDPLIMMTCGLFEGKVYLSTGTMTWRSVFPEKEKLSIRCIRKATL